MNIVNKLTVRHLWQNRGRTLITVLGIMLSVAMVCAVAGFVLSVRDVMYRTTIENRGDYHIAYHDISSKTAEQIAAEDVFGAHFTKETEDAGLVTLYVRLKNPERDYWEVASDVAAKYEVQSLSANAELLALEGVIAQDSVLMMFISIAAIAIVIIVAGSIIVIANAFYISASERVRQFGLLKSVGATKAQIGRSILFEAFLLAVIAIPLGIALGFLIQAAVLYLTNGLLVELNEMNNDTLHFRVVFHPLILYVSIAISAVTMLVSAWLPARRAAKTSPIDAIRQTRDIRIRRGQLKTSRLTEMLFGFEGTLAAKSLKRSKTKYRATVVTLAASVAMFISVSSLVWAINKGADMEYGGYDFDVIIGLNGSWEDAGKVEDSLQSIPNAQVKKYLRTLFETAVPNGFVTENALENMTAENHYGILLHLIPDSAFSKIAGQNGTGVLINTTGTFSSDNKIKEATPYECAIGTELPLGIWAEGKEAQKFGSVTISDVVSEIPLEISSALFDGSLINVLVPETAYKDLYQYSDAYTFFTVITSNPDDFCETAESILQAGDNKVFIENVAQITRLNRNIVLIIALFGYGFIAMLSLIAVTSVIATISTGMALRKQEFAMLSSAGMTPGGMNKMLNLESLMYGIKSLAIGLPIGVALSYLIHMAMTSTIVFDYQLPIPAMIVSTASVMLLTFCTMRYSRRKLRDGSIVEAIRNELA